MTEEANVALARQKRTRGAGRKPLHNGGRAITLGSRLFDAFEPGPPEERAGALRRQQARRPRPQHAQRGQVEVVVVHMREEHRVDPLRSVRRRPSPTQVRDAYAQQRIGEQANAPELHQHGGVAQPGESIGSRYVAAPPRSSAS
jgi:hypothetical protein